MSSHRDEVLEAQARLASAIDTRDWATIAATLTPDSASYGATGPEAVVARMQAFLGGVGRTQHLLGNQRVTELPDGSARVLAYGRIHHVGAGEMEGSFYECLGEYDDTWVRTESGWQLASRWFDIQIELGDRAVLRPAD